MKRTLSRTLAVAALGFILTSSLVSAQMGRISDEGQQTRTPLPVRLDPMNPPAKAQLQAITLDGDIDDLLGMVGSLGGLGCAFEVDDPPENITCADLDFEPCSPKENEMGGGFYFVNGFDLTKGVVVYNAQTQEMWLGLRVVGCIGDVDGDGSANTICPVGAASGIIENPGIGSTDGYRWDFDIDCSPAGQFNRNAWVEVRGPTNMTGDPSVDVTANIAYSTIEVRWKGNGGLDSTEIEVKLTGVDLLTNFPNGGFDVRVFAGSEEDCLGENRSDPGRCEPPVPALVGRKSVDDVCAGAVTTATITVTNVGLVPFDLQVFDDLPAGHTYVGGSGSGIGEPAPAGGDVLFTGPTLAPGDSTTFSFGIQTPVECFGEVTNFATATGTYTSPCYLEDPDFRSTEFDFSADYTCLLNTAAPEIQDQTVCEGADVTITVAATGGNLTYQWYTNADPNTPESGTLLGGETGSSLLLADVSEGDAATYCVFVSGDCGTVWRCADLTVNPPTVAGDIGDQTVCEGGDATFTVEASGVSLTYQWYKGGTDGSPQSGSPIEGATGASYTLNDLEEADEAVYCVLVTGECGTVWRCALLTVNPGTTAEPFDDQTACEDDDVTFTVTASGLNLTYQWYKAGTDGNPQSGSPIEGATGASYTLNDVVESDEAVYCVLVTGECGTVWRCALLTVNPTTTAGPIQDQTACEGEDATFTVTASGLNLTYQWYKGGTGGNPQSGSPIEGATGASYTLNDVVESDEAVYCVLVTGECGTVWQCALLTVNPGTTAEPFDDQTACEDDDVTFTVTASGLNLTYQWYKGGTEGASGSGTPIEGATGASYTLNDVQEADESIYCVLVTGECGTVWRCALLTVNPPTTAEPFDDQTTCEGEDVTFTVIADGLNLTYQWYKGGTDGASGSGTPIEGATGASYTLNDVVESDEAVYCVLVTGECGTVWRCALLTVNPGTVADDIDPQTRCVGDEATFTVNATGTNLFYQWYKNGDPNSSQSGSPLETENGSSLTLTELTESDEAVYCVYVSGDCGSVWKCALLTVSGAAFEVQAQGDTVCVGLEAEAEFTVTNTTDEMQDFEVAGSIGGAPQGVVHLNGVPGGESRTHTMTIRCEEPGAVEVSCAVTASLVGIEGCSATADPVAVTLYCQEPDVAIEKITDPRVTGDNSKVTIVVTNTGTAPLGPVRVSDHWPAGLNFDAGSLTSNCQVTASVENTATHTWITFSDFTLMPEATCTIMFNVDCLERDNEARIDTARVIAWCDGVDSENPDNLAFAVTDSDTSLVLCQGGEACPRTIGFWRQQARQRDNGSTKVCLAGMKNLWRCVLEETNVVEWTGKDLLFGVSLTEDILELPEGASGKGQLFQWMESQLLGPRPMTAHDMCEAQYIGLMLNVCSGALPASTPLSGSGGYSGTVAGAIAGIENALNTGQGIGYWKDVADAINNRAGVLADYCHDENDVMQNVDPCGGVMGTAAISARLALHAFPNPVSANEAFIQFNVPPQYADEKVEINLFDVSGRLVRKLVDEPRPAGLQGAHWDLRNDAGRRITAGIYFTRLRVAKEEKVIRLMVLSQR